MLPLNFIGLLHHLNCLVKEWKEGTEVNQFQSLSDFNKSGRFSTIDRQKAVGIYLHMPADVIHHDQQGPFFTNMVLL